MIARSLDKQEQVFYNETGRILWSICFENIRLVVNDTRGPLAPDTGTGTGIASYINNKHKVTFFGHRLTQIPQIFLDF